MHRDISEQTALPISTDFNDYTMIDQSGDARCGQTNSSDRAVQCSALIRYARFFCGLGYPLDFTGHPNEVHLQ